MRGKRLYGYIYRKYLERVGLYRYKIDQQLLRVDERNKLGMQVGIMKKVCLGNDRNVLEVVVMVI